MHSSAEQELQRLGVQRSVPMVNFNTFGFKACAEYFATADDEEHLVAILDLAADQNLPVFLLGGGSNIVITRDIPGITVRLGNRDIRYTPAPDGQVQVTADAGVNWHDLVMDTLEHGHQGLENLSLIPGTVGAAPVQNIGAYGVELVDRFCSLRAWHRPSRRFLTLGREDCAFTYRNSRLKREQGDWIVMSLTLFVGGDTPLVLEYPSLAEHLASGTIDTATARSVSEAVVAVRSARLPDPAVIGNAGSFFHNPIVSGSDHARIASLHSGLVSYPLPDGRFKLAAGWLIDSLGFKGVRRGAIGVHERQALVLVNHGGGTGVELLGLVEEIRLAVREAYGVELTVEPLIV